MKTDEKNKVVESFETTKKINKSSVNNFNSTPISPKFCINCGNPLDEGDRFCTECGSKVETEVIKSDKTPEEKTSSAIAGISSDRMASIAETSSRIFEEHNNIFQKTKFIENKSLPFQAYSTRQLEEKKKLPAGIYVYKLPAQTMYLKIEGIIGNSIRVSVRTEFANGTYGIENYDGTLCGTGIGESFLGRINDNTISGNFSGEFTGYCTFLKIE